MAIIRFKQGDIFEHGVGKCGLCLFYGHHGMAFGLGYESVKDKYDAFRNTEYPFDTNPNSAIEYSRNKYFVCVPHDYMSDNELLINLTEWLNFAHKNKIEKVALTGVRDSTKQAQTDINQERKNDRQNDDIRVKFIVKIVEDWFRDTKPFTEEILLIAMSDNYTRNYQEPIIIDL
jgi:hypothetical protein